jgi:anti-sigma regulatory factor (Ser/Thr protein kinase)
MSANRTFTIDTTRHAVSAFADDFADWAGRQGVPESSVRAFQVVFDELLTNAIDYALHDNPDPLLQVVLQLTGPALEAWVIDNGRAFDPLHDAAVPDLELSVEDRPIGGLGIHLVKSLMDQAEYRRDHDRNVLHLRKRHAA